MIWFKPFSLSYCAHLQPPSGSLLSSLQCGQRQTVWHGRTGPRGRLAAHAGEAGAGGVQVDRALLQGGRTAPPPGSPSEQRLPPLVVPLTCGLAGVAGLGRTGLGQAGVLHVGVGRHCEELTGNVFHFAARNLQQRVWPDLLAPPGLVRLLEGGGRGGGAGAPPHQPLHPVQRGEHGPTLPPPLPLHTAQSHRWLGDEGRLGYNISDNASPVHQCYWLPL